MTLIHEGNFIFEGERFTINSINSDKTVANNIFEWDNVSFIRAYQVDRLAFDTIVVDVICGDVGFTIEEETPGFMKFMEIASTKLNNFKMNWYDAVSFPLNKKNLTIIYDKSKSVVD